MQKTKHWLMMIAVLLSSLAANATTYSDWTSTNEGQGSTTSSNIYTITASAGDILTFDWLVSSESNYDWLTVTLNGSEILKRSGEYSGTYQHTFTSSGTYLMTVSYTKDESNDRNGDYAKVYNITTAGILESGTCGTNLTWKLTTELHLIVEGQGKMHDYSDMYNPPWYYYEVSMEKITILNGVTSIASYAFYHCSNITSITIPESVTNIGERAFGGCRGELIVNCNIPSASSYSSGVFYGSDFTKVTIGKGVKNIGDYAFYDCDKLTSITIPESMTNIGSYAFYGCDKLTSITIPYNVTSIGEWAFGYCYSLASITIPRRVTSIEDGTFFYCSNLTSITIPKSVTSIRERAFSNCSSLTSINIPEGVTSIGESAFHSCSSLTSINIPEGVTSIGGGAFYGCSSLTSITIPNTVTNIQYNSFFGCSKLTTITIPESVTSIGSGAFRDCNSLTSITIPYNVTSIGDYAFSFIENHLDITLCSNPKIEANAFKGSNYSIHLILNDDNAIDFETTNINTFDDITYNRTLATGKYGTIMLPFAPNAESLEDFAFFALSSNDGEYLLFDEVAEPQANTPYLYTLREGKEAKQITGGSTTISSEIVTPEMDGWKTVGSFTNQTIITEEDAENNYYAYTSADNQLHRVTKKLTVKPYRAYFTANGSQPAQLAIRTRGGDVTVIDAAEVEDLAPAVYYDLSGRRVDNPTKGMYIVNGKKVIL